MQIYKERVVPLLMVNWPLTRSCGRDWWPCGSLTDIRLVDGLFTRVNLPHCLMLPGFLRALVHDLQ